MKKPKSKRTTVNLSISLSPAMKKQAIANARAKGFEYSVSAYVGRLIEADTARRQALATTP